MPYPVLPDRRMPYDIDGTVIGYAIGGNAGTSFVDGFAGVYFTQPQLQEIQDADFVDPVAGATGTSIIGARFYIFFPERREVTAYAFLCSQSGPGAFTANVWEGSLDSTNGNDGTWETASLPSGASLAYAGLGFDAWRFQIKPISFTGGKRVARFRAQGNGASAAGVGVNGLHIYGEKTAGQTPDDIIFIDHDTTPGVEFTAPEDFGDRPLGTTVTRQFRVKNASATKTANTINIQANDADFTISTNGTTWVVTIDIASLAAGAESATMYIRNTTPAAGAALGPRYSRIIAGVGSWS